jgi:hypothetical protein
MAEEKKEMLSELQRLWEEGIDVGLIDSEYKDELSDLIVANELKYLLGHYGQAGNNRKAIKAWFNSYIGKFLTNFVNPSKYLKSMEKFTNVYKKCVDVELFENIEEDLVQKFYSTTELSALLVTYSRADGTVRESLRESLRTNVQSDSSRYARETKDYAEEIDRETTKYLPDDVSNLVSSYDTDIDSVVSNFISLLYLLFLDDNDGDINALPLIYSLYSLNDLLNILSSIEYLGRYLGRYRIFGIFEFMKMVASSKFTGNVELNSINYDTFFAHEDDHVEFPKLSKFHLLEQLN